MVRWKAVAGEGRGGEGKRGQGRGGTEARRAQATSAVGTNVGENLNFTLTCKISTYLVNIRGRGGRNVGELDSLSVDRVDAHT